MAERAGQDILILADLAGDGSNYQIIGSQTNVAIEESNDLVTFKSKVSRNPRHTVGGYNATMTLDHLYVPEDASLDYIKFAARYGTKVKVRVRDSGSDVEQADAIITSRSAQFPDAAPATVSVGLQISGGWSGIG